MKSAKDVDGDEGDVALLKQLARATEINFLAKRR